MSFRLRVLLIITGIALHSRLPALPDCLPVSFYLALALLLALVGLCQFPATQLPVVRRVMAASALFAAGFFWAMWLALWQFDQRLPQALEGEDFWLVGRVEGLPVVDAASDSTGGNRRSRRVDVRVEKTCLRLLPADCEQDGYAALLAGTLVTLNDYSQLPLLAGERWQLRVRVNRPHGFANPGSNDFEATQFQRGVMARGYIRETRFNQRLMPGPALQSVLAETINVSRWRAMLAAKIDAAGATADALQHRGLIKALVLGDRQGISDEQWQLFTETGTNHLVVISGLHVGFVALCVWHLVNRLLRLSPAVLLRLPAQHGAALAAVAAAGVYSLLAGFSLPTQRALIMVTVVMLARVGGRQTRPGDSLALAALMILLLDPLAVVSAGFWLSFMAVASLFMAFAGADSRRAHHGQDRWAARVWQAWVLPQWAVSVGLLLPLILWTGQTSLNAPLANMIAIPLVSLLVVPLCLLGALLLATDVPGGAGVLMLADGLLTVLQWVLGWFVQWTPGLWQPAFPSWPVMVLMLIGSVLLLLPRGLVPRWLASTLFVPLVWPSAPERPAPGEFWVQFLDVGQGLAVVVHTRHHDLLFDTGPALGPDFDAAQAAILPYLHLRQVHTLDALVISHWHADHSGGLASVLAQLPVRRLLSGGGDTGLSSTARVDPSDRIRAESCQAGQHWQYDGVSFSVLFPPSGWQSDGPNNQSCVLAIHAGGQQVLLTGDIEASAERWLLANQAHQLKSAVLQAPHHGSRSSSSTAFVQAVAPDAVVIPAGYRNRFDHPHDEVVARYEQVGARVFNTGQQGAVLFSLQAGQAQPQVLSVYRTDQRRYWFNQPLEPD